MKILVVSDIHGDYKTLDFILKKENFEKLIVLGDLFNYNLKKESLNDIKIINLLQKNKDRLILIKGNCDKFIDYEKYGLYAHEIFTINLNNHNVTLTHGNKYKRGFLPSFHGEIFLSGHTHIPSLTKEPKIIYANPGSIGNPRGGSVKSYIVFDNNEITIKDINGNIQKAIVI